MDASLGFAGGVMLAASYWSLLEPAIEMAEKSGIYGKEGIVISSLERKISSDFYFDIRSIDILPL